MSDTKSRVEDIWKKMNSGMPAKMPKPVMNKLSTPAKEKKSTTGNVSNVYAINLISKLIFTCEV